MKQSFQTKVDAVASECIAVRMRMLNRAITNIYDEALRPLGLKVSQMNLLIAAAKMQTARPAEICAALHLGLSTLSRNVDRMKARGWLEVIPDSDGRAQPFRLTDSGKLLLEEAYSAWRKAQKQAQALLGTEIADQLNEAVQRIGNSE